jgi:type I restriction enzyme M protein
VDALRFRSQTEKHELSALYEEKIKRMDNAGRNGGETVTHRRRQGIMEEIAAVLENIRKPL